MMEKRPIKIAVIAGEVSGDLLGADLIAALKQKTTSDIQLVGVGGHSLEARGLKSLFDYSELSIMGVTQVLKKLPRLVKLIKITANAIIAEKPDLLLIIDSPDFTHRVAKRVKSALPDLPVINYVCPSVWAWKESRATNMLAYVDHVLALLPFEPDVMKRLGGPPTSFVGHRLNSDSDIAAVLSQRQARQANAGSARTIVLLPGSRSSEVTRLLPVMEETAKLYVERNGPTEFLLPTVPRQEVFIRDAVATWDMSYRPQVSVDMEFKHQAFTKADMAIAASGTVILELALSGVPVVSVYKTDWIITLIRSRIKAWSAALPNLVADYVVVPEYFNETVRANMLVRWAERLSSETIERQSMLDGFALVREKLRTDQAPGAIGAEVVLSYLQTKKAGHI
jgi:lipid-A-disaccharide synthase